MPQYIGRFAPSPTGLLHFGSLVTALASYLDARHHRGQWLLRIDDIDQVRVVKDSAPQILKTLKIFGFKHDGDIRWQNQHIKDYEAELNRLAAEDLLYPCVCSRQDILSISPSGIYLGTCQDWGIDLTTPHSIRLKVNGEISFNDHIQGIYQQSLPSRVGDFIIKRKDGIFAYQLATVVDDAAQGITHIVRGEDLLDSTPRQIYLQQLLNYPEIKYGHIQIVVNKNGQKLSKQNKDYPVDLANPLKTLKKALVFLNQPLPSNVDTVQQLLEKASINWNIKAAKAA